MTLTIDHDQLTMTTIMILSFEKHDHDNDQHEQREVHTIESEVEEPVCKRSREEPRPPRGSISSTGNIFNDNHCNEKDDYEDVFRKGTYLCNIFLFCRVWGTNVTSMGKTCDRQVNCDKKNKMTTMKGDENMKWEGTEINQ